MSEPAAIAEDYIAAWNETDSAARRAKLSEAWTPAASYADPLARAEGLPAICDMIEGVHRRFPNFRFVLSGQPSGYGEFVRFRWTYGPAGTEPPIEGSDVVMIEDGKIAKVIGFLDKVPQ